MSSFFTVPASQRKRKREDRNAAPASKKRGVDAKSEETGNRRARDREESISGSDLDEDDEIESGVSAEESESDSDEGETAADRRLKLAERYLDNVREEVDEVGFDAADIDRDLIAQRLKEDVVCGRQWASSARAMANFFSERMNSKGGLSDKLLLNWLLPQRLTHSSAPIRNP